jgi:hypothetical protein
MSIYNVTIELSEVDAMALAQFVKRVGWREFRENASSDLEAGSIRSAIFQLQIALRECGFAPR